VNELGQQRSRKWGGGHTAQERNVDPDKIAVRAGEVVELSLLPNPENAISHNAHEKNNEARRERNEDTAKVVLGVNGLGRGDAKVEYEQSHRHGKDAVTQGSQTVDVLTCNTVVERMHPKEFSIVVSAKAWGLSFTRRVMEKTI